MFKFFKKNTKKIEMYEVVYRDIDTVITETMDKAGLGGMVANAPHIEIISVKAL